MDEKPNILDRWDISIDELTKLVDTNGSLRGMLFGYIAEPKLKRMWFEKPPAVYIGKHDDHNRKKKGDLFVRYKEHDFDIESKSLQTIQNWKDGEIWRGFAQVDGSDRRTIKLPDGSTIETTLLLYKEFDILAVNLFSFDNTWRFVFAKNSDLPHSTATKYSAEQQKHLVKSMIPVSWPPEGIFRDEPFSLMDEIIEHRLANPEPPKIVIEKVAKKKGKKVVEAEVIRLFN